MVATATKRIKLHSLQAKFRQSQSLRRGFAGGIGSGKSWAGAYDVLRRAQSGRLYMVVTPTYRMLNDATWRTLKALARELQFLHAENKTDLRLTLGNGAEILGRTSDDPDRLRGPNLAGVWLDEASLMPEAVLDILLGRLREGGEQGWLSATFTPRGRRHWTYRVFAESPDSELFVSRSADNPFLPPGFVESLAGRYTPQWARQELGGEFVEIEGAEFSAGWIDWFEKWPRDDNLVVKTLALDPSKGRSDKHGDYSAYVALGVDQNDVLYIQADVARRPIDRMVSEGVALYRKFRPHAFAVEGNAWQDLLAPDFVEEFRRQGMLAPDVWLLNNQVNKVVRIRRLGGYLAARRVKFKAGCDSTQLLVDQLLDFPVGDHDDGPDAMEMAVRIAEQLTA